MNRAMNAIAVTATRVVPGGKAAISGPTTGMVPRLAGLVSTARNGKIAPTETTSANALTSISTAVASAWRRRRGGKARYKACSAAPLVIGVVRLGGGLI